MLSPTDFTVTTDCAVSKGCIVSCFSLNTLSERNASDSSFRWMNTDCFDQKHWKCWLVTQLALVWSVRKVISRSMNPTILCMLLVRFARLLCRLKCPFMYLGPINSKSTREMMILPSRRYHFESGSNQCHQHGIPSQGTRFNVLPRSTSCGDFFHSCASHHNDCSSRTSGLSSTKTSTHEVEVFRTVAHFIVPHGHSLNVPQLAPQEKADNHLIKQFGFKPVSSDDHQAHVDWASKVLMTLYTILAREKIMCERMLVTELIGDLRCCV